jgi:nitroreductase
MEAMQAIMTRQSIRRYIDKNVPDNDVQLLLKAAMQAPSANNYQPWHIVVIRERDLLHEIPKFHTYAQMLHQAALAIAICGDLNIEKNIDYLALDCAAATENVLIAAHAMGLGAVWLGIFPRKERMTRLKNLLKLPPHIVPVSLISLGYAADHKPLQDRFKSVRVHFNS